ncbi:CBS and PB1 domain protein [Ceratobasidium sp. AG-Ba]|nr:CBS and PB1 domain protein [Ceratobasidium sp. AG-Ba]
MGLDELHLRVLAASSDDPKEQMNAQKVLRLMKKGRHWVLVQRLVLAGATTRKRHVNESLPIFLDSAIGGGIAAVAISTVMIVIFGEYVSLDWSCSFRAPLTLLLQNYPASTLRSLWPSDWCGQCALSAVYDVHLCSHCLADRQTTRLGSWTDEENTYKKAELKSFLQFHREGQEPLRDDEISILNGVLSLNEKKVSQIMTPMEDVVTLSSDAILDHKRVDAILTSGYSRFPVHEPGKPTSFVGLLLIKKLLVYDPAQQLPVSAFPLSILPEARPTISCFQALDYFQTGRSHLLLISTDPGQPQGALGVITLEDIIEEIISEEIVDETDRYEDNRHKRRAKRQSRLPSCEGKGSPTWSSS